MLWLTKTTINTSGPGYFSKWHPLVHGLSYLQCGVGMQFIFHDDLQKVGI